MNNHLQAVLTPIWMS